jgi:hypothetical protein
MVDIEDGQHAIVEGINGTGKTVFCWNALCPTAHRVIVMDTEGMEFEMLPAVSVERAIRLMKSDYSFYVRIPFSGDLKADLERLDSFCKGVRNLRRKGPRTIIYFDEFTDFCDATTIPPNLRSMLRTARKRNVTIVAGTQRPQLMNKTMVANAVHRFYFFMSEYDAEQIKGYAPFVAERLNEIPYKSYRCLYQGPDTQVVVLAPIQPYNWAARLKGK